MDKIFRRDLKSIFKSLLKNKIQNRKRNHREWYFVNNRMTNLSAVRRNIVAQTSLSEKSLRSITKNRSDIKEDNPDISIASVEDTRL